MNRRSDTKVFADDVFAAGPDTLLIVNSQGRIERVNPQVKTAFGYSQAELVGQPLDVLIPEADRQAHCQHVAQFMAHPHIRRMGTGLDLSGRRKDGREFPVDVALWPMKAGRKFRTLAIVSDLTERRRLEKEVQEISNRELSRIGQDLHDGLCQHLISTALAANLLAQRLRRRSQPEASDAAQLAELIDQAITATRQFARGLYPVKLDAEGLTSALQELAVIIAQQFNVRCDFLCPQPVSVPERLVANNLYRIAQEAATNAARHARSRRIVIELQGATGTVRLSVQDDGGGLPEHWERSSGMGIHLMRYRANLIGARLEVGAIPAGGTAVAATWRSNSQRPLDHR